MFLFTTSLTAFLALIWAWQGPRWLVGYFGASTGIAGLVLLGVPWSPETYLIAEALRNVLAGLVGLQAIRSALSRSEWRTGRLKAILGVGAAGLFGLFITTYLPMPLDGQWGLRGMVGVMLGTMAILAQAARHETLQGIEDVGVRWLFLVCFADALNLGAAEDGKVRVIADLLNLLTWAAATFMVTREALNAASASRRSSRQLR